VERRWGREGLMQEKMIPLKDAQAQMDKVVETMGKKFVAFVMDIESLREANNNLQTLLLQQQKELDELRPKEEGEVEGEVVG
jgi:uncharacterized coiled-coil DUF342 family protein